jgi:CHAT domain-containing protein
MKTKTKSRLFFSLLLVIFSISVQPALSVESNIQKRNQEEIEALLKISKIHLQLGQFRSAIAELNRAEAIPSSNTHLKALIKTRIGSAESGMGKYSKAVSAYKSSLEQETSVSTLNNLVIALQKLQQSSLLKAKEAYSAEETQKYHKQAKDYQSQALKYATEAFAISQGQTSLSAVRSLIEYHNLTNHQLNHEQLARGRAILERLPTSHSLGFMMLNWAAIDVNNTDTWLKSAKYLAQRLGNRSLESYVFLELGHFYNLSGKLQQALSAARSAQSLSRSKLPSDSLYRSQWLAAQIAQKMGLDFIAINNYRNAIASIDILGRSIEPTSSEEISQFNLEIQPVYKNALELILNKPNIRATDLKQALVISDKLRLSQLRSYFGDHCFEIKPQERGNSHQKNRNAASINSIILKDKTVFILELPNGQLKKSEAKITRSQLINQAQQWSEQLMTGYTWEFLTGSRFFYDLIIKPFEAELKQANLSVLVFTHDGILRNLPMAALSNDQKFLIEKWAVISSLGIKSTSQSIEKPKLKALVFGLSKPQQQGWSTLDMVPSEVENVNQSVDGEKFLNRDFTVNNLRQQLQQDHYSVVHLATHGYFGGSAENSFILAYDQKIDLLQLEDILTHTRENPTLLVLSACQTAVNSELAFLGLAGVAAKSGVDSTLGSLWQVQDESQSEVMKYFYSDLETEDENRTMKPSQRYALALQKIQIEQIRSLVHPQIWAALTLIGDW